MAVGTRISVGLFGPLGRFALACAVFGGFGVLVLFFCFQLLLVPCLCLVLSGFRALGFGS